MALSSAVFLDKDGTLVDDLPYNVDPARVRLKADAGPALARLQAGGYALVLVSNQPGVALGRFPESALAAVWAALAEQLSRHGVALTAIYYCPHLPDGRDRRHGRGCGCRKPEPGLLLRAAAELGLDLGRSWMVGDILDDVEAGNRAGCRSVLVDVGSETEWRFGPCRRPDCTVPGLDWAAECILAAAPAPSPCRAGGFWPSLAAGLLP